MSFSDVVSNTPNSPAINRIGRFSIARELGRGSVGCVYLGHDPVIARDVAIKTFHPGLDAAEKKHYEQQFINEARAAGRLSHPNIITVYDASSEGGTTYIAMEYLKGSELQKMLDSGTRFKALEVAAIALKIAEALNHAHQNQVIHRDLKPANIYMVGGKEPKLMDFNIARSPNRLPNKSSIDNSPHTLFQCNLLGTPNYMSPEQARGADVDGRTDLYSLGAVMYELLVGRKPFKGDGTEELLQQIVNKVAKAPHEINPKIPVELSQIVMKAMSKRPEKRYPDAATMAQDIRRYIARHKRIRRIEKIRKATTDKGTRASMMGQQNILLWIGYLGWAGALGIAGFMLMR